MSQFSTRTYFLHFKKLQAVLIVVRIMSHGLGILCKICLMWFMLLLQSMGYNMPIHQDINTQRKEIEKMIQVKTVVIT